MDHTDSHDPKSRRERGVLAQRAYRRRHSTKFKQLQEENGRLRETIRDIIATSSGHYVSPEFQDALSRAKEAAAAAEGPGDEQPGSSLEDSPGRRRRAGGATKQDQTTELPDGRMRGVSDGSAPEGIPKVRPDPGEPAPGGPRMYLGDSMFSLEGRLFWDYATYLFLQLQKSTVFPDMQKTSHTTDPAKAEAAFEQDFIIAMGTARLAHHRSTQPDAHPRDASSAVAEHHRRVPSPRDLGLARHSDFWKTPEQAAEYLRRNLPPGEFDTVTAALAGRLGADGERNVGRRISPFARNAACFDDGRPRWSKVFLSLAVGSWVSGSGSIDGHTVDF